MPNHRVLEPKERATYDDLDTCIHLQAGKQKQREVKYDLLRVPRREKAELNSSTPFSVAPGATEIVFTAFRSHN